MIDKYYPSNKRFLQSARSHQHLWLRTHLETESADQKRVLLPDEKAYGGQNFFSDKVCESVRQRFPNAFKPNRANQPRGLVCDALRSEHIPFNLFAPLVDYLGS